VEFLEHRLPNGLEIIAERNASAYSMALGFFVRTGSRDEWDGIAGCSHFLEHMMFKGTPRRTADDVNREFDEMGARYNAYTSEENTVYYAAVLPECQTRAAELLADIMRPSLRDDDFHMEKKVILEEIQMYEDQPPFGADEKIREVFFQDHPLSRSVLGTPESIAEMTVDAMRDYFRRRYGPENVLLAATGHVDFDALVATAERCCGHWEPSGATRPMPPARPRHETVVLQKEIATQHYGLLVSAAPAADDPRRFAARLLAMVIGDESGSRLYWDLLDPGHAEHVSMHHQEYEGAGAMLTFLSCQPEEIDANLRRIEEVFHRSMADGFLEDELRQAKNKGRSRMVLSSERPRGRLFSVGPDWLYRHEYRSLDDDLATLESLTADELHAVMADFPLCPTATVTVGP